MQTILGAGGPVSTALATILAQGHESVRLVSRRPIATSGNTTWVGADLKDYDSLLRAATGATVIYMCAGLQYNKSVWKVEWPLIMQNLIRLAKATGARLIFFDNVYMYGLVDGPMKEDTPYKPCSVKGEIRATIANILMDEAKAGNIRASIARAADFYGSGGLNSFFDLMVLKRLAAGKAAQWMGNITTKHSFTYVPDAANGMALLGQNPDSDNQIWHLPTSPALSGNEFVQLAADAYKVKPGASKVSKPMLQLIGLFNKVIGETAEMYYQYKYDYLFDSTKFERAFGQKPTPYRSGIALAAKSFKNTCVEDNRI